MRKEPIRWDPSSFHHSMVSTAKCCTVHHLWYSARICAVHFLAWSAVLGTLVRLARSPTADLHTTDQVTTDARMRATTTPRGWGEILRGGGGSRLFEHSTPLFPCGNYQSNSDQGHAPRQPERKRQGQRCTSSDRQVPPPFAITCSSFSSSALSTASPPCADGRLVKTKSGCENAAATRAVTGRISIGRTTADRQLGPYG